MICDDINTHQKQHLENIYKTKPCEELPRFSGILSEILKHKSEDIQYALGNFGLNIKNFVSVINTESPHPDLYRLFDGDLVSDVEGSFGRDAADVLKLAAYGKEIKLSQVVLDNLKKSVTKHKNYKAIFKSLDHPKDNLLNVRFVPLKCARDEIRARKVMQVVNTNLLYKKGCVFWKASENHFMSYARHENMYKSDIDEACSRRDHFNNLGLKIMGEEIEKSVEALKKQSTDSQYFGFNKISITEAAIILAKQLKFEYFAHEKGDSKVAIDTRLFKYRFFDDSNKLFDDSHVPQLLLDLRVYSYQELSEVASVETKNVIEHLEQFPEADGHPLFDFYRVLVPGVNYLSHQKSPYHFRMFDGTICRETKAPNAQMKLDMELIKSKEIAAILLGERDGDCYFISYF